MSAFDGRTRRVLPKASENDLTGMEEKLEELRRAMANEKAARTQLAQQSENVGNIWGTGKRGSIKNFKVPKRKKKSIRPPQPQGERQNELPQNPKSQIKPQPPVGPSSQARKMSESRAALMDRRVAAEQRHEQRTAVEEDIEVIESTKVPDTPSECNAEGGALLGGPEFDEGDSHASFLAALREWRSGGEEEEGATAKLSGKGKAVCEVQTEPFARPAIATKKRAERPSSARGSYLERLARGQAACGCTK